MSSLLNSKSIISYFEESVREFPNNIAIKYEDQEISYNELNEKVNDLALQLAKLKTDEEEIIAVLLSPSVEMIVSLLAILKSGCAYLPIDIETPSSRMSFLIQDSNSKVILTISTLKIDIDNVTRINIDESVSRQDDIFVFPQVRETNLAYVIYTSGTTGNPKGVLIEHRNVISLFEATKQLFIFNQKDIWCLFHSYSFDFSVWEIFGALLTGAKLVIIPRSLARDSENFVKLLNEERITVLNQTPSAFRNLKIELTLNWKSNYLRYIIFGGEKLNPSIIQNWKNKFQNIQFINMFGITETTVHVTYRKITDDEINSDISNIGLALPNAVLYIYDNNQLKKIAPELEGELCIGGGGVGRGYLNRENLTNEKFLDHETGKIYRSGDIVKVIDQDNIHYQGRNDNQVKIRGFRIELEEIEKNILKIDGISNAIVIDKSDDNGNFYLCAYYISNTEFKPKEFKTILSNSLPSYMVPVFYIKINEVPLTINGKLDKGRLPLPYITNNSASVINNIHEYKLSGIWKNVLGNNINFDLETSFFEVGGNSLLASQLIYEINKQLNISYSLKEFYAFPFIKNMCAFINDKKTVPLIKQSETLDSYPLTMLQLDMVNDIENVNTIAYNVTKVYNLKGYIDEIKLINTFKKLVRKYEILRVSIHRDGDTYYQKVNDYPEVDIKLIETCKEELFLLDNYRSPYHITDSIPLFKIKLLSKNEIEKILIFDAHHIIIDEVSVGLIVKEAFEIYSGREVLGETISFLDYAIWLNNSFKNEFMKSQENYWMEKFNSFKINMLPSDQNDNLITINYFTEVFNLSQEKVKELNLYAIHSNTSTYVVLLTIIKMVIAIETEENDITIETISANRENPYTRNIIGCVINSLFIKSKIDTRKSFKENLKIVTQSYFEARDNSDYPFELVEKYIKNKHHLSQKFIATKINYIPYNSAVISNELMKIESLIQHKKSSRHDFSVLIQETNDGIEINLLYNRKKHSLTQIERISQNINNVLNKVFYEIQDTF